MPSTPDLSDAELLAEYAKRKLERNGVCENGYDLMKGFGIGLVVGTVRKASYYFNQPVNSCQFSECIGPSYFWFWCWYNG